MSSGSHTVVHDTGKWLQYGITKQGLKKKIIMATLLLRDDGEFESCQLCGHEQGLLDELVQPAATVLSIYCTV